MEKLQKKFSKTKWTKMETKTLSLESKVRRGQATKERGSSNVYFKRGGRKLYKKLKDIGNPKMLAGIMQKSVIKM